MKRPTRRLTTTIATPAELTTSAPVVMPAVEFVGRHPSVTMTIPACGRCGQPRDLAGRCSCSFEVGQ